MQMHAGVAAPAAASGQPPAGQGHDTNTGDGAAAAALNSAWTRRRPWLDVFAGTRPLCRPWQATPLQPLAGSHIIFSPGRMGQLKILWDSHGRKDPNTYIMLVCFLQLVLMSAFLIIGVLVASILSHDDLELSGDHGCAGNVCTPTATGVASQSLQHLIWLPKLSPAATQIVSNVQKEGAPLQALSDLNPTPASWVPAAVTPQFDVVGSTSAAPAADGRGGAAATITRLYSDHQFFWFAAFAQAWLLMFVWTQLFSVCITLRATGFSVSHDCRLWRAWPLRLVWRLLGRNAGFTPNEDFSEPVLGAKVRVLHALCAYHRCLATGRTYRLMHMPHPAVPVLQLASMHLHACLLKDWTACCCIHLTVTVPASCHLQGATVYIGPLCT